MFSALAATSEAYFGALSRIGEKAYHTLSSRSIGMLQKKKASSVFTWLSHFRYFPVSSQGGYLASKMFRFRHPRQISVIVEGGALALKSKCKLSETGVRRKQKRPGQTAEE